MRIIVSGDVQREGQSSNIRTFHRLLSGPIERITGIKPELASTGEILPKSDWWQSLETKAHLLDRYGHEGIFWIGFEFPLGFTTECDRLGIPYVDLNAHPIRFCDDLFIGLKTASDISRHVVNEQEFYFASQILQARSENISGIAITKDALLMVGQTPFDRAVVVDSKVKKFDDFKDELVALAKQHSMIIWKAHPAAINNEPTAVLNLMTKEAKIGCHRATKINIYKLLSESNISTVVGLSSSVLKEAPYFEKKAVRFLRDLSAGYHPLTAETLCSEELWYDILHPYGMVIKQPNQYKVGRSRNRLRQIFNSGWGYPFFNPEK